MFLYRSHSDEIFWFSQSDDDLLRLNILDEIDNGANIVAKAKISPPIKPETELYKHIINGNYVEKGASFENAVPTLIKNNNDRRFCIYTYSDMENPFPTVYIYDLIKNRNIAKASGASIFLHYEPDPVDPKNKKKDEGRLYFYCNIVMSSNIYYPKSNINN